MKEFNGTYATKGNEFLNLGSDACMESNNAFFSAVFFFSVLYSSQVLFKIIYWAVFYFSMGRRTEVRDGLNKACFQGAPHSQNAGIYLGRRVTFVITDHEKVVALVGALCSQTVCKVILRLPLPLPWKIFFPD